MGVKKYRIMFQAYGDGCDSSSGPGAVSAKTKRGMTAQKFDLKTILANSGAPPQRSAGRLFKGRLASS